MTKKTIIALIWLATSVAGLAYVAPNGNTVNPTPYREQIASGTIEPLTPGAIEQKNRRAIVYIEEPAKDKPGLEYTGTGFFICDHVIVTNYHMVRYAKAFRFTRYDGTVINGGRVIIANAQCDVACIEVAPHSSDAWVYLSPDTQYETVGERVTIIGYPQDHYTVSNGTIEKFYGDNTMTMVVAIQTTAWGDHGQSGSPIFNAYGAVIGIVRGGDDKVHHAFGLSTDVMWEALQLTSGDHPNGFTTGITNGVDVRGDDEKQYDSTHSL